ncbi:hypothetical protein BG015_009220 [Linnemannia schmuckeri]|uniref:DUF833-domain-containing protein n=1 Tax=Linnemannia schmuckeri TaxID=64567 RepID=A0A9P5RVU3_9FUNG|nr:hypothetical protein BG015_009220 [Linnemannia schmuckeri]
MCILLWTLPSSNHPRFKFALASNRDEFLARETSRADFWDLDPILYKAIRQSSSSSDDIPTPVPAPSSQRPSPVGVLTGQDLQPSQAINYTIQEVFSFSNQEQEQEQVALTLNTKDIPGTWLGMTTHGDFVALTNFREDGAYMATKRDPKLSRGKVCGEFLVSMAAAHHKEEQDEEDEKVDVDSTRGSETGSVSASPSTDEIVNGSEKKSRNRRESRVRKDQAEKWIRRRAVGWEDEFEGLNLLVVQNAGDQQCVGGNRLGSELTVFNASDTTTTDAVTGRILEGSVVGVSNSVFTRPWTKVKVGVNALETVLNQSITLFGTGLHASCNSNTSSEAGHVTVDGDTKEIAWLVIQMLTLLRTNTQPFSEEDSTNLLTLVQGLSKRVFIPRIGLGGPTMEYGTRSSTIALFGRERDGEAGVAVFVEKVWYSDKDVVTGERTEYAPDSSQGLVWWQGRVGQPRQQWRHVVGDELEHLLNHARIIRHP